MKKEEIKELSKYFFWGLVVLLLFLSYKIIKPYLITLISAFILAYFVRPLFLFFSEHMKKTYAAFLCLLLIVLIVIIPLGSLIGGITSQATQIFQEANSSAFLDKLSSANLFEKIGLDFRDIVEKFSWSLVSLLSTSVVYLPNLLITLIVLFAGIFYFLVGWNDFTKTLKQYIPFKDKQKIADEISEITRSLIFGFLLIAVIEFLIAILGFYIFGVRQYFLLPALIFFLAFLPGIGPAIVWVPTAIYYLFEKNWFTFAGILFVGLVLSIFIDTILRAKIMGKKAKINSLVMLIGILGGISLFGVFGFIIGPIVLVYAIRLSEKLVNP